MNLSLNRVPLPVWYGVAAIVGVGAAYWLAKQAAGAAGKVAANVGRALDNGAADVTSPNNIVYRATNQAGHWFFGMDKQDTIGTAIYGLFHKDYDPNAGVPNLFGHKKDGAVWYGYDTTAADAAAQAAANSQIAKDVAQFGGGYGALTK